MVSTIIKIKNVKKANMVGFAIIGLAFILLLGTITLDTDTSNSSSRDSDDDDDNDINGIANVDLENTILFEINETTLGEEVIETTNFPNIKIGSSKIYDPLFHRRDIELRSTAFSLRDLPIAIDSSLAEDEDFLGILVMA